MINHIDILDTLVREIPNLYEFPNPISVETKDASMLHYHYKNKCFIWYSRQIVCMIWMWCSKTNYKNKLANQSDRNWLKINCWVIQLKKTRQVESLWVHTGVPSFGWKSPWSGIPCHGWVSAERLMSTKYLRIRLQKYIKYVYWDIIHFFESPSQTPLTTTLLSVPYMTL